MFSEDDEVLDAEEVFAVFDVLLLDLHEDVDLVESQLHVLAPCADDLHRHRLPRLVVERLYHFPEGATA